MHTIISLPAGIMIEAIIADRTENRMRVVAQGFSDTIELMRQGGTWTLESGEAVQFEFMAAASPVEKAAQRKTRLRLVARATA